MRVDRPTEPGPRLTLAERDRRHAGLRSIMEKQGFDAIVVGSFQGRERLEGYLIDDFLDAVVVLPLKSPPVLLAFGGSRISRIFESQRRGHDIWVPDVRLSAGGAAVAGVLKERGLARGRIGLVGFGPTAPGEMEGLLPLGFHTNLVKALPEATLADFTRDFTDFMLVKSEEEIALLRFAARVSEEACRVMMETARPGVSEALVYADTVREIHRWGCDLRYPFFSLQSGKDNIGWGVPRWSVRAEPPRILEAGDLVQAEIHTCYGGQEGQVNFSVALDPVDEVVRRLEDVARASYEAAIAAIRPGVTFASVVQAMEKPIAEAGCWSKTPLLHTLTFGSTGFTSVNRAQLKGTREETIEGAARPGIRRGELVLQEGMGLEVEPNACLGMVRVNIGAGVLVTSRGAEELNSLATRVQHVG
ncbi:MAG TPA: M24 family metallopeptidase [Reyranella sp.]|jgi:Xaa-Pro aminopeptidase|nr:M24 family metallopeptidase [Reyranella sp.]